MRSDGFAVGDVALSLEYFRAPFCLLRVRWRLFSIRGLYLLVPYRYFEYL